MLFRSNDTATTEIYTQRDTLSLHDALPTSTMDALTAAEEAGLIPDAAAQRLREAWRLASRLRSANTLLSGHTSDVLPSDRQQLDGIGRILEYPPRSATRVEEDYLGVTRRARRVFEKLFYG